MPDQEPLLGTNGRHPVSVFCSTEAVLNQMNWLDVMFATRNIAHKPVAPWHNSIRVGVICRVGLFVTPTNTTLSFGIEEPV